MANAHEIALRYKSPRYLRIEEAEARLENKHDDHKWPFMVSGDGAPPIQERKPCVKYNIFKNAIGTLVNFAMGESRYPQVDAGSSEDDADIDEDWGLNPEDSVTLEKWINGPLTTAARLKAVFPEGTSMAMAGGGVAMVACIRNGLPTLTPLPAKWCTPKLNAITGEVDELTVFYPYIVEEYSEIERKWVDKCRLYKRVIDRTRDVVYLPGEGRPDGIQPAWVEDPAQTVTHNLGYCPVRWYAYDRPCPTAAHFDGHPIHRLLYSEGDAINLTLSQRHRAAVYSGDPQIWETGVDSNINPAPSARFARPQISLAASDPTDPTKTIGIWTTGPSSAFGGSTTARMKGAGVVWRYPSSESKVGMLQLEPGALEAMNSNQSDLRMKIAEDLSVVFIDPTDIKSFGAMSGKALAFVFARQIAQTDKLRADAGDFLILACIDLLLRLCLTVGEKAGKGLRIPGLKKVLPILQKSVAELETPQIPGQPEQPAVKAWFGPQLRLQWGRYFDLSPEEENFLVSMCVAAYGASLMPLEVVVEKLRGVFSFSSTEELIERIQEEAAHKQAMALQQADEQGAIGAKYAPDGKQPVNKDAKPDQRFPPKPKAKAKGKGSASGAKGDLKS